VEIPPGTDLSSARVVLTGGAGILIDTAQTDSALRRVGRQRGRLFFKSDSALVTLRRGRSGLYAVKVVVHDAALGTDPMPVVSASLQIGGASFATSLSCPPRGGRHFTCRG
jgi:hypothetical protein